MTALLSPLAAQAQNVAIVNGKPVPKARVDALIKQVAKQAPSQQLPPELEAGSGRSRHREIFTQEAEKRGLAGTPDYKTQMEPRARAADPALLSDCQDATR